MTKACLSAARTSSGANSAWRRVRRGGRAADAVSVSSLRCRLCETNDLPCVISPECNYGSTAERDRPEVLGERGERGARAGRAGRR